MAKRWSIAIVAVLATASCTSQDSAAPDKDGVEIRQHDGSVFDAKVTSGGATLHVLINEVETDVVDVTYDFGDPVIGFRLDYARGAGEFRCRGSCSQRRC